MTGLRIGISGWSYPHWKGTFYPRDFKDADRLAYYAEHFDTVEINSTLYAPPRPSVLKRWVETVPPGFLFAIKGSRLFTHYQHLDATAGDVTTFFKTLEILGGQLGPVLFQLPPDWACDVPALASFLSLLPTGFRTAFEFRNSTWWIPEVLDLLAKHQAAFCIFDLKQKISPLETTSDFIYVRLHGPKRPYFGHYSEEALENWARHIRSWRNSGLDAFFYFNNTDKGAATVDAQLLKRISRSVKKPTKT